MGKHILCTGGSGYIGSHTVIRLVESGYDVTILDSFVNAEKNVNSRINELCGKTIRVIECDLQDQAATEKVFKENKFDAVIHYAALKAVGESVEKPLLYYRNNLVGCINLMEAMEKHGTTNLVMSSSATVYQPKETPLTEADPLGPSNPYGQTKFFMEQILQDVFTSMQLRQQGEKGKVWRFSILRYFNPVGAHPSGRIGESPDVPMNLLPTIQQVAVKRRPHLKIFGNDWPTPDGTGVRDYIHVLDLADGHIAALKKLFDGKQDEPCCDVYNLGSGSGVSVLEMVKLFEKESGVKIPYEITDRRPGDLATVIADPSKANKELNWKATRTMAEACASAWKWQSSNPDGFRD